MSLHKGKIAKKINNILLHVHTHGNKIQESCTSIEKPEPGMGGLQLGKRDKLGWVLLPGQRACNLLIYQDCMVEWKLWKNTSQVTLENQKGVKFVEPSFKNGSGAFKPAIG
jgi:hypothetical protein